MTTQAHHHHASARTQSVVVQVGGMQFAAEKNKVEACLGREPGVLGVEANPVAQTATVTFDPETTTAEALRERVVECGYHCAGESVPEHVCNVEAPQAEPGKDRSPYAVMGHGIYRAMIPDRRWSRGLRGALAPIGDHWKIPLLKMHSQSGHMRSPRKGADDQATRSTLPVRAPRKVQII